MKNKIIVSSILTIALCLSMIAGSTFALFTSESKVDVTVNAGTVDVDVDASNLTIGSTLGTALGTADLTDNVITLTNLVPGDYVTFTLKVTNKSTVAVKYRALVKTVEDNGLLDGLVITYDNEFASKWATLDPATADVSEVVVTISLPETAGDDYQNTSCKLAYVVEAVQGNVDVVDDVADLDKTLLEGGNVDLTTDVTVNTNDTTANSGYGKTGVKVTGGEFNGNGNTLTVNNANSTWDCAINITAGTVKNLTVSGTMRGIFMGGATGDVYIDNVIFDDVIYTFNSDDGNKEYGVYISNSTLNGWTSFSNCHKEVIFTNCTFGEGNGYAFCRPYNASVFENCVFEEGFEFDTTKASEIVFINCYYGDTLITNENAATLADSDGNLFFYNGLGSLKIPYEVETEADLKDALVNGDHVTLTEDVVVDSAVATMPNGSTTEAYGNKVGVVQYGGVLDGDGNTISSTNGGYVVVTHGGTIKNLVVDSGDRGIVTYAPTEDVIIDNVIVDGPGYGINSTEYGNVDIIVTNSTVNGWTSLAGFNHIYFTNCKLGENTAKVWQGYGYDRDYDRLVKPYVNATFTDCEFDEGLYIDLSGLAAGHTVIIDNCTVNGVVLTADNYASYITIELPSGRTLADCVVFR